MADLAIARKSKPALAIVGLILTWGIVATIAGTTAFLARGAATFRDWSILMSPMIIYYGTWAFVTIGIFSLLNRPAASAWQRAVRIPAHLAMYAILAVVSPMIFAPATWPDWVYGSRAVAFHGLTLAIYGFCFLALTAEKHYRRARNEEQLRRQAELRAAQLDNSLNLARFDALRMQINPHFFFNALNSVGSLVRTSQHEEAYRAIEVLGDLLRNVLRRSNERTVPLSQELALIRNYVELEQVRYGDRLSMIESISEDSLDFDVPALILQPLVENVVKHVLSKSHESVELTIAASVVDDRTLQLLIADNGPGFDSSIVSTSRSVGIPNILRRLQLFYDDLATIDIRGRSAGGTEIVILLPESPVAELDEPQIQQAVATN
ncbi:MAG: histidine kinase [Woeseiaceae bacterium]|nr:histidine kinase [Woeseiaceae bacterium]